VSERVTYKSNTTTFIVSMLFYCSGQHVSTFTGPSSGPSKIQILKLTMFNTSWAPKRLYS